MDLIFTNKNHEDMGVLQDFDLDLAFGADENDFECSVPAASHCCEAGSLLYMEGTEYGGIVDTIESDTEAKEVKYKGRTWHGILGSKVIEPLKEGEGSGGSKLPEGYTELTHIESTGTQYLNTKFVPNSNTKVVMDCEVAYPSGWSMVMGAYSSGAYFSWWTNNALICAYYGSTNQKVTGATERTTLIADKNNWSDGVSSMNFTATSFASTYSMYLFSINNGGSYANATMKLYSCQVYDNDVLVRDFIPCKNPDGEVGLYDLVTKAFFGNSGTGSFVAGTVPRKLPDGYTQVEYIQSSGTQYIDTGFKPKYDSRVVMDVSDLSSTTGLLYGARNTNSSTDSKQFLFYLSSATSVRADYFGTNATLTISDRTARTTIDQNANVTKAFGGTMTNNAVSSGEGSYSIYLFTVNNAGSPHQSSANYRLYSCRIYDAGTLVRDFVPCVNASGVAGLYDMTNGVFYQNAGSGTFATGAEVEATEETGSGGTVGGVTIQGEDADGNSLVGKYLVISGDANECISFILNRIGLSSLLCGFGEVAGVDIQEYQFHRFTDAYSGLTGMLASAGQKLHTEARDGQVVLSAEAIVDYTADEEFDSDLVDFVAIKKFNAVNHLICLGSGELENRTIIHLYADKDGNISQEQTQVDLDEVVAVYEDTSAETEDLIQKGTEELLKLWEPDKLKVDFDDSTDSYDVGDIVGAYDNITGISVAAVITKKIVTIKNGQVNISYKVGE